MTPADAPRIHDRAHAAGRWCMWFLAERAGKAAAWAVIESTRRAYDEGGELSAIVEFRRHFPLIADNAKAGECVRIIAGWRKVPDQPPRGARPHRARRAS